MKRSFVALATVLLLNGCSFGFEWLQMLRAKRAIAARNPHAALEIFELIVDDRPDSDSSLQAARLGARVAHLEVKNYPLAVKFYNQMILKAPDAEERKSAQRYIAQIYFENLLDYNQALQEYEKLLKLDHQQEEGFRYRLNVAKCHFNLNNLQQSLLEIESILAKNATPEQAFEAKVLKATVLMQNKQLAEAAGLWETILKEFPERSEKENVGLNLVVCYEELKDFGKAIDVLERMKPGYPQPDFLDLRIERLKERKDNQPGAQGWKR